MRASISYRLRLQHVRVVAVVLGLWLLSASKIFCQYAPGETEFHRPNILDPQLSDPSSGRPDWIIPQVQRIYPKDNRLSQPNPRTLHPSDLGVIQTNWAFKHSTVNRTALANLESSKEHALMLSETAGDKVEVMRSHAALAQLFVEKGDTDQALFHISAAESSLNEIKDSSLRVDLLQTKFAVHMQAGDYETAIADKQQLMIRFRELNDHLGQGESYLGEAWAFQSLGNIPRALGCYEAAVIEFENAKYADGLVRAQIGLGSLYQSVSEWNKAAEEYRLAAPRASKAQLARILISAAEILSTNGGESEAIAAYDRAQTMIEQESEPDLQASIFIGKARVQISRREFGLAEENLAGARFTVSPSVNRSTKAAVIATEGELYYWRATVLPSPNSMTLLKLSMNSYDEALSLMRSVKDQSGEIGVLTNLGLSCEAMGKPQMALEYYLNALHMMEEVRYLARLEEFRGHFADQSAALYVRAIELEIESHQIEAAFALSERARARILLDRLGNAHLNERMQGEPELLAREQKLRAEDIALERHLSQELAKPVTESDPQRVESLQSNLAKINVSYEAVLGELKLSNPAFAASMGISPISLAEAQHLIDRDTSIVSFVAASDATYAFVVGKKNFRVTKLNISLADLQSRIDVFRDFSAENNVSPVLLQLYNALITPIQSQLRTHHLVIVPYGVLHDLPFSALTPDGKRFLADDYLISYVPSVSSLVYLQEKIKYVKPRVLILANSGEEGVPYLSAADDEARAVATILDAKPVFGKEASAAVLLRDAKNYDIIHIVAHFEIDRTNPTASRILLGIGDDGEGALDFASVYSLNLHKTNLVVLSGCQSQDGKRTRGDDVLGFSQAFLFAGSASVIASLWSVDDEATKALMVSFYSKLKATGDKVESLRKAQQEVRQNHQNPYYWAGFVLTGH
jgi:CHAT domain-containing protein/tetratricopeptide (TPR) repeat protein